MDPSGIEIPASIQKRLLNDHSLDVEIDRFALTATQVKKYNLPHSKDAIKRSDPNYAKYVNNYGLVAVELDALHPATMEKLIKEAIERHLDMSTIEQEIIIQEREISELADLRRGIIETAENSGVSL